jgi:hypothetical protein
MSAAPQAPDRREDLSRQNQFETHALGRGPGKKHALVAAGSRRGDVAAERSEPDDLLDLLERACREAIAAGRFEAVARLVAEAARLRKGRPAADDPSHPWEKFRKHFT